MLGDSNPAYTRTEFICDVCGGSYKIPKNKTCRQTYCSKKCADVAHSKRMMGEGNSWHKDGKGNTPYQMGFKSYVRKAVLKRDDYKCAICDGTHRLTIHHVDENKTNDTLWNLITLCQACHLRHHKSLPENLPEELSSKALSDLAKARTFTT